MGSPEHKVSRYWGGLPGAWVGPTGQADRPRRQQTSICRKVTEQDRQTATRWVQAALAAGQFRYCDGDKLFPKHIWYCDSDRQFWFGFAVNQTAGTYKGWPITEAEKIETFG